MTRMALLAPRLARRCIATSLRCHAEILPGAPRTDTAEIVDRSGNGTPTLRVDGQTVPYQERRPMNSIIYIVGLVVVVVVILSLVGFL